MNIKPFIEHIRNGGPQKIYKFDNGYGASVICHLFSYGGDQGLWELGVIKFDENGKWGLVYNTPITDDVIGRLSEEEVEDYLQQIQQLPK